ncbi:hypothetical protein DSO57_1032857 [Entomophthora muscae]|uniref:Uncharacterized protein n=1 Tax=Entomophthora muscae TaxID=34485 RepID=A0ACC2SD57_9FUNG|nr:hypothetical protein DSO57_1032857 [Entomophthora muscae]
MGIIETFFGVEQMHSACAVKSRFVSPLMLALVRTAFAGFAVMVVMAKLVDSYHTPLNYIMYLTNLSFYSLTLYLLVR